MCWLQDMADGREGSQQARKGEPMEPEETAS
jgi:hypothetical protein